MVGCSPDGAAPDGAPGCSGVGLQRDSWVPRVRASSLNMKNKNNAHCERITRRRDHHTRACNIRQLLRERVRCES